MQIEWRSKQRRTDEKPAKTGIEIGLDWKLMKVAEADVFQPPNLSTGRRHGSRFLLLLERIPPPLLQGPAPPPPPLPPPPPPPPFRNIPKRLVSFHWFRCSDSNAIQINYNSISCRGVAIAYG